MMMHLELTARKKRNKIKNDKRIELRDRIARALTTERRAIALYFCADWIRKEKKRNIDNRTRKPLIQHQSNK